MTDALFEVYLVYRFARLLALEFVIMSGLPVCQSFDALELSPKCNQTHLR